MDLYTIRNELQNGKAIYDLRLKVTYYARVSTDTDEQLHSIKNQIDYYEEYIRANANWTFISGYVDEGLSGTDVTKRASFLRMIADAEQGKFDFIITKEISRFSRNTLDSINYTQQLLAAGVGVLFQSDNINTLMPDAELRLTIMSSIAQDEVRKISERVKFGFKRAVEKGVVLGSNRIWGYSKSAGKLVIVEEEAELVRKIFDLYANHNLGMRSICTTLTAQGYKNSNGNDFSFSTIKGILTNPKYKGYYCGNKTHKTDYKLAEVKYLPPTEWVTYKDETGEVVPPIVSEELWTRANEILTQRSQKQRAAAPAVYNGRYTYSGKIICEQHQVPYYRANYQYKSGNKEVWQCKMYTEKGRSGCAAPIIYTTELDAVMQQAAEQVIDNKAAISHDLAQIYVDLSNKSSNKEELNKLRLAIKNYEKLKDKLLDLSVQQRISDDEFTERNQRFNQEMQKLQGKIKELESQTEKNREVAAAAEKLRQQIDRELNFEQGLGGQLTAALLDRIEVLPNSAENQVDLAVYLSVYAQAIPFTLERHRGKTTSVCCRAFMSSEPISQRKLRR